MDEEYFESDEFLFEDLETSELNWQNTLQNDGCLSFLPQQTPVHTYDKFSTYQQVSPFQSHTGIKGNQVIQGFQGIQGNQGIQGAFSLIPPEDISYAVPNASNIPPKSAANFISGDASPATSQCFGAEESSHGNGKRPPSAIEDVTLRKKRKEENDVDEFSREALPRIAKNTLTLPALGSPLTIPRPGDPAMVFLRKELGGLPNKSVQVLNLSAELRDLPGMGLFAINMTLFEKLRKLPAFWGYRLRMPGSFVLRVKVPKAKGKKADDLGLKSESNVPTSQKPIAVKAEVLVKHDGSGSDQEGSCNIAGNGAANAIHMNNGIPQAEPTNQLSAQNSQVNQFHQLLQMGQRLNTMGTGAPTMQGMVNQFAEFSRRTVQQVQILQQNVGLLPAPAVGMLQLPAVQPVGLLQKAMSDNRDVTKPLNNPMSHILVSPREGHVANEAAKRSDAFNNNLIERMLHLQIQTLQTELAIKQQQFLSQSNLPQQNHALLQQNLLVQEAISQKLRMLQSKADGGRQAVVSPALSQSMNTGLTESLSSVTAVTSPNSARVDSGGNGGGVTPESADFDGDAIKREAGVDQSEATAVESASEYDVVEMNVHNHLLIYFRLIARVFSFDKCCTGARIKALDFLTEPSSEHSLNFHGLLHESFVEVLLRSENIRVIKAKLNEFIDNLSRPMRQKMKGFSSEPLFAFVTPAMRDDLRVALFDELQPGGRTLRQRLYARAEQWDGESDLGVEGLGQLVLEGVMVKLGVFELDDMGRSFETCKEGKDVMHLSSSNDESWVHCLLHWNLLLNSNENTHNREGGKQKHSSWIAERTKMVYQPKIVTDRLHLAQNENLHRKVVRMREVCFQKLGLLRKAWASKAGGDIDDSSSEGNQSSSSSPRMPGASAKQPPPHKGSSKSKLDLSKGAYRVDMVTPVQEVGDHTPTTATASEAQRSRELSNSITMTASDIDNFSILYGAPTVEEEDAAVSAADQLSRIYGIY